MKKEFLVEYVIDGQDVVKLVILTATSTNDAYEQLENRKDITILRITPQ